MNPIQKNIKSVLEIENLSPVEQKEIILRVGGIIYQNVLMRVIETMTEENQDEFEKLLDNNAQPEEIFTFLKDKVQDFEKIIEEEATKFKNKTDNIMSQIGN
ncbi:hypothetical protein A2814_00210 [Candidatus Nomurabacteria bacterium RIFCSPHIGHO2_01_FULL_38_19]|uniref:Uncharacterized protein n=1 Tax=Candidatus Nomurabacteria bacterium RIFCSPHIGHO2_01_FULL_38_19 TaxID=1801732 RepID=A0A1F6UQS9_9BACT|nr:MAG: hypothetical protein A2814_00210 [Candidatus Nomurabacteria bacterium RIFCSPHIGHO2_01_FULL_38_19]